MIDEQESERVSRLRTRAEIKRAAAVTSIRSVNALALRATSNPDVVPQFLVAVTDLDMLWSQFRSEDDAALDYLIQLDKSDEYAADLPGEVRALISESKAIAEKLIPKGAAAVDFSFINSNPTSKVGPLQTPIVQNSSTSRLPEIPLPKFDGDFRYWPTFRDRFMASVDNHRPELAPIDKMYHLIGCLHGPAADAVRGIPVASDNYELAWLTLSRRFNRPRLVAASLVEKLLSVPSSTQESLQELTNFSSVFSESVSLLKALNIPDLGSFLLFALAFRRLPLSTRKEFESNATSDFPSLSELLTFVETRVAILELVGEPPRKHNNSNSGPYKPVQGGQPRKGGDRYQKQLPSNPASLVVTSPNKACPCCKESHTLELCKRFKSWDVKERVRCVRENKLCFVCLSADHWADKCKSKTRCHHCKRKHHHLVHNSANSGDIPNGEDAQSPDPPLCASTVFPQSNHTSVVLGTALVHARNQAGSWQTLRALIDSASQISAVTSACAKRLGLKCARWTAPVSGLGGVPIVDVQGRAEVAVQPRFAVEPVLAVHAWVLPSITADLPRNNLPVGIKDRYSNLALADPAFNVAAPIDILLGSDVYPFIMNGKKIVVDECLPAAFSSIFGWVLIGPVSGADVGPYHSMPVSLTVSIEQLMDNFWRVEEPEPAPEVFTDEGRCERIFREQCVRLPSGRFSVPLPFRSSVSDNMFVGSRDIAIKRFESLERKLTADPDLSKLYIDFMREYISLGHMTVTSSPGVYYIPHHAVYRPDDGDKKLRVVFDASATSYRGPSLNNCLLPGPKLQQDIVDILTRFRVHRHAFTADVVKMYRQILILPEYRKYQHIVWRESPHDRLQDYVLNTVTYGVNCAPFLALRVLQSIASDDCDNFLLVRHALKYQTYVDDICVGADSEAQALELQSNLISVLSKSGLELKKWATNTASILRVIPADCRGSGPLPFDTADAFSIKVLGIEWHHETDEFCCALRLDPAPVYTKRGILSLVARIFDPLGLFAPATFLAKSIMQQTWNVKLSWDAPLPIDIQSRWAAFVADLPSLLTVRVPRYIQARNGAPCMLLGFCDASQRGYAAVVYVRILDAPPDSCIFLLGTKTKLAPLKALTVPRLELNAAILLARWLGRLSHALTSLLNIVGTHAWSDSTIVLSWLTVHHDSFKTYVSNRVHQIQVLLPNCQWHHVESSLNPADCASRGVTPSELAQFSLYWQGPPIIYTDPSDWKPCPPPPSDISELPEVRPIVCAVRADDAPVEWFTVFSCFDRMVRVTAHVIRFISLCRNGKSTSRPPAFLSKSELDHATQVLVLESQRIHLANLRRELSNNVRVSSKPLSRLCPFIDADAVIRVGGRLRHSSLTYDCKHPVLLAKRSYFARLLCEKWHKVTGHSGPRVVAALISRKYWVVSVRSVLHEVLSRCVVCVRLTAKPVQPFMADLPAARVQQCRPFARVGIDYAGPLTMRELRLRKSRTYKIYIAVFVCFSVKAVHLEVVSDLTTDAFLAAFDRFVARRGLPSDIYSDNGTNFVGADKKLQALINSPEGQVSIANSRSNCVWHFNPPSAPHFGGLWEAAVRSTKRLLVRIIGTHVFTFEEFSTILSRIEAILNSRPLTPASNDPHDLDCLTPGHFLIGQPLLTVPPRSTPDNVRNVRDRWKLVDQCHQAFWRRWSNEYLTTLQQRSKWSGSVPNLKINDMVVVIDNQCPPLSWRLGRITEVLPGADSTVRVARVLTSTGQITRPAVKLVLLPVDQLVN